MTRTKSHPHADSTPMRDRWRNDPPTKGQLAYADRLGINCPANIRRGKLFDLIIARTRLNPKRRYQFSLRRLLLWTTVVALLCSAANTLGTSWMLAVCGITVVGGIRTATNWRVAGVVSVLGGAVVGAVAGCISIALFVGARTPLSYLFFDVIGGGFAGCVVGAWLFGVTEILCRGVDWIDRCFSRLGVKPDAPTQAD